MKKLLFALLVLGGLHSTNAQYKSEVKVNIANVIAIASVELGYEYFLDDNQSVGAEFHINDRFSYLLEYSDRKFKTNSFLVNYNYYFSPEEKGSFYAYPFLKYRFGKHEDTRAGREDTPMDSFIIGLGIGYKWAWNDKFAIAPFVSIARNFSEKVNERFWAVEPNAGISVGYRF
ncbi:MAG: DUF3575 domain-containing protein [Bacteroidota bacterium]|nr:DUF3575 domain-containing protein [Bacteroidota bacterium]